MAKRVRIAPTARPPRRRGRGLAIALLAAVFLVAWSGARAWLGGAREVLFVYVREENTTGLAAMPLPESEAPSGFQPESGRVRLPPGQRRLPPGTKLLVLRETFVSGLLVETRAICLRRLPGVAPGRTAAGGGAVEGALLAVDLVFSVGPEGGGSPVTVRVRAQDREMTLEPGREWRLGAVFEDGTVVVFEAGDPGFAGRLRDAFGKGRPVSVLSVTLFGPWHTDRIEPGSEGEG